jgi:transcriptional regulator with XRE-family HTH domain
MTRSFLRTTREKNSLTLKKTSEELGISEQYLWQIEKGLRTPSLDVACKMEQFFKIPVCELLKKG